MITKFGPQLRSLAGACTLSFYGVPKQLDDPWEDRQLALLAAMSAARRYKTSPKWMEEASTTTAIADRPGHETSTSAPSALMDADDGNGRWICKLRHNLMMPTRRRHGAPQSDAEPSLSPSVPPEWPDDKLVAPGGLMA